MADLTITTVAERPEYIDRIYELDDSWPEFMGHDKLANALFNQVPEAFPDYCVVATDEAGRLVARGRAIPFSTEPEGRDLYPDGGWDSVLLWGFSDRRAGRQPDAVSALEIAVDVAYTGRGLSHTMLAALRSAVRKQGHDTLVAPVRPNAKHLRPEQPMGDYLLELREDGLPVDPWLRVHVRAGARVIAVAPASMVMAGSLAEWRAWTGLPFDQSGEVVVPEALVPVRCDVEHDYAVYVEPNVWMHHDLTA
jgi:GNAT superfamily N-acetyltransferase